MGMNKFILEIGESVLVHLLKWNEVEMNISTHLKAESEILPP